MMAQVQQTLGDRNVQRNAALVGIEVMPMQAAFRVKPIRNKGANFAHGVSARRFYLDDVGAYVGHQLAAINTHGAGQVQYANSGQRLLTAGSLGHFEILTWHGEAHGDFTYRATSPWRRASATCAASMMDS